MERDIKRRFANEVISPNCRIQRMDEGFVGRNNFVVFCSSDRPSQNGHVTHSAVQINVVRGCVSTVLARETIYLAYLGCIKVNVKTLS